MNITRFRSENIGSILRIEVAPYFLFATFRPDGRSTIRAAGLVLKAGHEWTSIYCAPESMGLQVDEAHQGPGKVYTPQIVGFIPGEDIDAAEPLLVFDNIPVIARLFTANGHTRIVGTPETPLLLIAPSNTGTIPDERAGRALNLAGEQQFPPFYFV